jgi:glucosamine--fructose-6-phosphate aminotransferase (isomerizing)
MTSAGQHTHHEIHSQPAAWTAGLEVLNANAAALRALWRDGGYEHVLFTGCGSPYYAGQAVAAALREMGIAADGLPASEIWLNPRASYAQNRRTLLVALSRSGKTSEVLHACEAFRARGQGDLLTLSCYPEAPLATAGKLNIVLPSGQETSLAQTRAFTTLYLAALACGALWSGMDTVLEDLAEMPDACAKLLTRAQPALYRLGESRELNHFYFLGSGTRHGLARELALKMKEMSISDSEPFHFLEFRHGPQTMVGPNALVVGLVSESNFDREMKVLEDMRVLGGTTLSIGQRECDIHFHAGAGELARDLLYLPAGQLLALARALSKGLDPDAPHNLNAWVKI